MLIRRANGDLVVRPFRGLRRPKTTTRRPLMSEHSSIEWTDTTWNPVTGCTKLSPGCDHCYAETFAERWRGIPGHPFENGFDLTLRPERLDQPFRWAKPRKVFVNSMSDLFHTGIPDGFISQVFAVMAATPEHTYQVLTKRHGRMRALLSSPEFADRVREEGTGWYGAAPGTPWPLPNVWLGVSVEDQKRADLRVPALLRTPAAARFLSCEPLLGPINLHQAVWTMGSERGHGLSASYVHAGDCCRRFHGIDWVIAGGESGPGARPMHPEWARSLRDQCQSAGIAFLFKQWGAFAPEDHGHQRGAVTFIDRRGQSWNGMEKLAPADAVRMRRVGKKAAGRELDGHAWDDFPSLLVREGGDR
ncbi:phage Gp37/Gp68 family protein [Nonomuraea dietziae]